MQAKSHRGRLDHELNQEDEVEEQLGLSLKRREVERPRCRLVNVLRRVVDGHRQAVGENDDDDERLEPGVEGDAVRQLPDWVVPLETEQ